MSKTKFQEKKPLYLIFQTAFIGDVLLLVPVLKRLRALEPKACLYLVCRIGVGIGDLLLKCELVDKIYEVKKGDRASYKNVLNRLQAFYFERVFCFHHSFRTAAFISQLKAKKKIGFKSFWNFWTFDLRFPYYKRLSEPLRALTLLSEKDEETRNNIDKLLRDKTSHCPWRTEDKNEIPPWASACLKSFLLKKEGEHQKEKIIFVAPGAGHKMRRWTQNGFLNLSALLIKKGWKVHFIGAPSEREQIQTFLDAVPGTKNWAGQTSLYETLLLFLRGSGLVAHDSGAAHLAALVGLPTVSIFGPTALKWGYRPWQNNSIVLQKNLPCRPCYPHGPDVCPLNTHDCMKSIQAQEVYQALMSVVQK